ncbi:hypothetical protein ILUMI_16559 [Ignelater luminosus]|uniref:Uncharacterized protein n=1 Tax=Ignelater luminosus TaxID=2038154 RepID=A0A8K0CLI5_IGNLU|nr:hypothetical protein ILUMI_16559 [Ignelater luminosus]
MTTPVFTILAESRPCCGETATYKHFEKFDPWNHQSSSMTRFWDTPQSHTILNDSFPTQPQASQDNGYMWGSSSVWQPWSPSEIPRTPTRTPPGFTSNREIEEVAPSTATQSSI